MRCNPFILLFLALSFLALSPTVFAGEVDAIKADINCDSDRVCSFSITLKHGDEGWKHYANKWEILDSKGKVLGVRKLWHPHVNEQPFTRSLSGVKIPANVNEVTVRGHDLVHEYGGKDLIVKIPAK